MPTNKKKKGGNKKKDGAARSNAANKDNLTGLDEILSNPEQMAAAQKEAIENGGGYKPRTGKENAQIGLKGFTQATQNPAMFTDAMSMLNDPGAVKEAEAMMKDPEFKTEISQYMDTLKNNPGYVQAIAEARRKYEALLTDPEKMKEQMNKYNAMMKAQQDAAPAAATAAAATGETPEAGEATDGTPAAGNAADETPATTKTSGEVAGVEEGEKAPALEGKEGVAETGKAEDAAGGEAAPVEAGKK